MLDKDSQTVFQSIKESWENFRNPIDVELTESRITGKDNTIKSLQERLDKQEKMLENVLYSGVNQKQSATIWNSIYQKSITKKSELLKEVDRAKKSFLHTAILDILVNDSIAPNAVTNDIIEITSKNKVINKELKEFQKKFDVDSILLSIVDDFIACGEYYLSIDSKQGEGITAIHDDIDQGETVAVYEGFTPSNFLKMGTVNSRNTTQTVDADKMVHFCLGTKKLRIKLETAGGSKKLEKYVRIGKPLFYGVFDLLMDLTLLTTLIPASYLQKINNTSIIGVQMSEGTDPKKAFQICRRYEQVLNKLTSFDSSTGDITVSDVISAAGKFKCIPIIGDKGRLEKNDPRYEEITDVSVLQELKKDICGSIGVPYNFIYGGDLLKGDTLKQFARYVRKLHGVQMAVTTGLKQLVTIHLNNKGQRPVYEELNVKFTNALISVDELDKVEFLSTLVSVLSDITTSFKTIATENQGSINGKVLQDFLNRYLMIVNLEKLITLPSGEIKAIESKIVVDDFKDKVNEVIKVLDKDGSRHVKLIEELKSNNEKLEQFGQVLDVVVDKKLSKESSKKK